MVATPCSTICRMHGTNTFGAVSVAIQTHATVS